MGTSWSEVRGDAFRADGDGERFAALVGGSMADVGAEVVDGCAASGRGCRSLEPDVSIAICFVVAGSLRL